MNIERTYRRLNKALRLAQSGEAKSVLAAAQEILATCIKYGDVLGSPGSVRDYLRLILHDREYEVFVVVLLDAQNRVLATDELFRGTLTQTSVYPREVVKTAIDLPNWETNLRTWGKRRTLGESCRGSTSAGGPLVRRVTP